MCVCARIKVDLDDVNAWGTDGHDDDDGYYRAECGRCGSEDRWYVGDYGDWRFTEEQPIGMGGWYSTEVEDENSCFSIVRCDRCGPVEQEEDGSVYECTKANLKRLKAAKKKGKK